MDGYTGSKRRQPLNCTVALKYVVVAHRVNRQLCKRVNLAAVPMQRTYGGSRRE
jgi:hypothetical protein